MKQSINQSMAGRAGDEKHLYVVPATNLRCLHLRAKFSHDGAGLGGVGAQRGCVWKAVTASC
jgi:hypothetical protein